MDPRQPLNSAQIPMTPTQQRAAAREEQMTLMAMQLMQLQRTIWMMAKAAGGRVEIDESEMNPLWEVRYERPDPKGTKLVVISAAMPDPTEDQIVSLSARLTGTAKDPRDEAINVGIVDYPLAYVVGRLAQYAVWHEKLWLSRAFFDELKTKG